MATLKDYYVLTKPGIIYANVMTAAAGFLLASKGSVDLTRLIFTLVGIGLVIASACIANNYIDRKIDARMKRTKNRALVTGSITPVRALMLAAIFSVLGLSVLAIKVNALSVYLGLTALFSYLALYGLAKRRTVHGTLVGSIAGSMALLAGYGAVSGQLDETAAILFIILAAWQMPHFYAIAIFRLKDYKAAGLPVLPAVRGIAVTKLQMIVYTGLFVAACLALALRGHAGLIYVLTMGLIGLRWLQLAVQGLTAADDAKWARKFFGFSLIVLLVFSFTISIDAWVV